MKIALQIVVTVAALCCLGISAAPASAKTVKECNAEYEANKPAIRAAKQLKKDFVAACRAGTETIPGGEVAVPPQAPVTTPAAAPAPLPAPAPIPTTPQSPPITQTPTRTAPVAPPAPVSASEIQAQASCPTGLVVWVNTNSRIYHFKGHRDYGNTKAGTFMCEAAALAAGNRAAKNEKHP